MKLEQLKTRGFRFLYYTMQMYSAANGNHPDRFSLANQPSHVYAPDKQKKSNRVKKTSRKSSIL